MRTYWMLLIFITLIASLRLTGSHRETGGLASHSHAHGGATSQDESITFREGKGLHVPNQTAQLIGLRIEDVTETRVLGIWSFEVQIYRAAHGGESALASGYIPGLKATLLQPGESVTVTSGGESLTAQVTGLQTLPGAGKTEVLVAITDPNGKLKPGDFLNIEVPQANGAGSLSVQRAALLRTLEGSFVYTLSGDRFVRTAVKTGAMNERFVEITDGLYAGDRVVVEPVNLLWMAELQSLRGGKSCADGH